MQVIHSRETIPNSIFLAGPTERYPSPKSSWRQEALAILNEFMFSGMVFVPEPRNWVRSSVALGDFAHAMQLQWEEAALIRADIIAFWIPRDMETLPGLTTNIEWGTWHKSGKVVLGCPDDAPHVRSIKFQAEWYKVPTTSTLRHTMELAMDRARFAVTPRALTS